MCVWFAFARSLEIFSHHRVSIKESFSGSCACSYCTASEIPVIGSKIISFCVRLGFRAVPDTAGASVPGYHAFWAERRASLQAEYKEMVKQYHEAEISRILQKAV